MLQPLRRWIRKSRRRGPALTGLAVAAALLLGATAEAQAVPRILRPGTRPWVFIGGLGFSGAVFGDWGTSRYYRGNWRSELHRFKLMEDIGGHFSGDASGPALGASFEQSFNEHYFMFEAGPKFWWDIQPVKDLGLYIAPEVRIGPAVSVNGDAHGWFNTQMGCSGRLILGDRGIVFFKPFTLDLLADFDGSWVGFWDVMLGGGVTW